MFWHFGLWLVDHFGNVLGKTVVTCLWTVNKWEWLIPSCVFIEYFFYRIQKSKSKSILKPAEICDLLKACILIACSMMMSYIDTSMMYHLIKSQSVIKLYIFYNMLEVRVLMFALSHAALFRQTKELLRYVHKVVYSLKFYDCVSVHHNSILYKEPTRCSFGSIVY